MEELYKVLIVDDESFAREALELAVNWERLGFELIGGAADGWQAMEMIAEYQPDLVITDIAMPGMDGLELISRVREQMYYQPKFIILSAYGTFDYAKEAMRLGVETYILKPIIRTEVKQKLTEVKEEMDREKREKAVKDKMDRSLEKLSSTYMMRLLNGMAGEEILYKLEMILRLKEKDRRLCAVKGVRDRQSFVYALRKAGIVPEQYEIMFLTPNFVAVILDYEKDDLGTVILQALLEEEDSVYIVIDLGFVANWKDIQESWKLADQVMDCCFYRMEKSRIFSKASMESLKQKNHGYSKEILGEPESGNLEDGRQVEIYCNTIKSHNIEPEQLRIMVLARLLEMQDDTREMLRQQVHWMFFEELKNLWIQIVTEKKETLDTENISGQIENYIRQHFRENITIQNMANTLCYNEVYLGKLVKKETGMSFRQYLNKVRLEYAEKRLKDSDDSMIEISGDSGFSNPDYFCKKFREKNGMTPTEFRKR